MPAAAVQTQLEFEDPRRTEVPHVPWPAKPVAGDSFQYQSLLPLLKDALRHEIPLIGIDPEIKRASELIRAAGGSAVQALGSAFAAKFEDLAEELHRITGFRGSHYHVPSLAKLNELRGKGDPETEFHLRKLNHLAHLDTLLTTVGRESFLAMAAPCFWDVKFAPKRTSSFLVAVYEDPRVQEAYRITAEGSVYKTLSDAASPGDIARRVNDGRTLSLDQVKERFVDTGYRELVRLSAWDHPKEEVLMHHLLANATNDPEASHCIFTWTAHEARFLADRINSRAEPALRARFAAGARHMPAKDRDGAFADFESAAANILCGTSVIESSAARPCLFGYTYNPTAQPGLAARREALIAPGGALYQLLAPGGHDWKLFCAGKGKDEGASILHDANVADARK